MTNRRYSLGRDSSVSSPRHSFTLVELIVVLTIIFVLTGLVFTAAGFIAKKGARSRAESEMAALAAALENYKSDNGNYPRDPGNGSGNGNCSSNQSTTDSLDANTSGLQVGDPTSSAYQSASQYLYGQLSGDHDNSDPTASTNYNAVLDTTNEKANRVYFNFPPSMLSISVITAANSPNAAVPGRITGPTAATGAIGPAAAINLTGAPAGTGASGGGSGPTGGTGPTGNNTYKVNFIRDPFGYPYAYSTAYQCWVDQGSNGNQQGYNPSYDMWSTAGSICNNCAGQPSQKCCTVAQSEAQSQWIKNW